ncbi:DUF6385 domain-containing protein [Desulfosporosinus meridiei]|uniref:DUF6385 domain-containing protein n=1 Tax=Desulfosporosinus meridiei (strain ATCC BAA-275 / DSM 13257 / KCTC 12902 / NCIMB 13706 / S10) TaxID=768704 RepID=J7IKU0_DESMD|nr:DUF6385 domain-containing protein [Desulfosporosinus meridiei]AFQ42382.1 hypothetical protein Desmer_0321 [Desulfosporosinus meridiei DSM 13257]
MRRNMTGTFNRVPNGNFLRRSKAQDDFPESWLQIGGNNESTWRFISESMVNPTLEINNSTATRSGIIQTKEASLSIGKDKEWLFKVNLKGGRPDTQVYIRIYPISLEGNVSKPIEYYFRIGLKKEQISQVISAGYNVAFFRLEIGIMGQGSLDIYKVIAYTLSPGTMKRRVTNNNKAWTHKIESINTIEEIKKPIRLASPIPIQVPVNVHATVSGDVRNLTPIRDKVQVYGNNQVPIATSVSGRVQVEISSHEFYESLEDVTATEKMSSTITRDISALHRCSFSVLNFGSDPAFIQIELSPDGVHWLTEESLQEVPPGMLALVCPKNFLRFIRIAYKSENFTRLRIWVQAQN